MGDLISMADFKRKAGQSNNVQVNVVLQQVEEAMEHSTRLMRDMPGLSTVYMREKAVIDAMKAREKADALAWSIGYRIYQDEAGPKGWFLQPK